VLAERIRRAGRTIPDAASLSVFDNVYADLPAQLAEQRAEFEAHPGSVRAGG